MPTNRATSCLLASCRSSCSPRSSSSRPRYPGWRGDRTGGNDPGGNALDENAAFDKFIVAFDGLLGRAAPISTADMQRFTDFILQVTYPPSPIRNLDDTLTATELAGRNVFFGPVTDAVLDCNGCHRIDPTAERRRGPTR